MFSDRFGFWQKSDMKYFPEKTDYLVQHYHCDLGADFTDKIIMFLEILKIDRHQLKTVGQISKYTIAKKINGYFPKC